MKGLLAVLVVGLLGGGIAAVVVRKTAPDTTITHTEPAPPPVTETVIVPAAGQTLVTGTLQSFSADGAVVDLIHTPFTINAVERGAQRNATVEAALINGQRKTIYWYAGQPLPVSGGGGGLDLGPAHVDADARGVTWSLTGTSAFKPGRYSFGSSVAVGSAGLAAPDDNGVSFDADDHTVLTATEGVIVHLDSPALKVGGPGTLRLAGTFTVKTASGSKPATTVAMGAGPFEVTLAPDPAGVTVTATLEGPVTSK